MDINIKKERDQVDNYIITTNITIIAAFVILLSIDKPQNIYINSASGVSLFFLVISLLCFFWHKYRFPVKQTMFAEEEKRIIGNISGNIADFAENFLIPKSISTLKKDGISENSKNEEIKKDLSNGKKVIVTHLEFLSSMLESNYNKCFNKPLKEKNAKVKFYLDRFCILYRYKIFTLGIFSFIVAIFISLYA